MESENYIKKWLEKLLATVPLPQEIFGQAGEDTAFLTKQDGDSLK